MNPNLQKALAAVLKGQKFQDVAREHGIEVGSDDYARLRDTALERFKSTRPIVKEVSVSMEPRDPAARKSDEAIQDADKPGRLVAVFSTFNIMDDEGDVVLPGAVHEESDVPFTFAHNWSHPSMGKGDIRVELDRAVWDGHLFVTDMPSAAETFASIKNMGSRQEYSWSFYVKDAVIEEDEKAPWGFKRLIKDTEMVEVCAAIRGVNRQTHTLLAKGATSLSQQDLVTIKNSILETLLGMPLADVPVVDLTGEPDDVSDEGHKGSRLEDQINGARAALDDLVERVSSLAETRAQEGRSIGKANLDLLADLALALSAHAATLAGLKAPVTEPATDSSDLIKIFAGANRILAETYSQ